MKFQYTGIMQFKSIFCAVFFVVLGGCASGPPAPVLERSANVAAPVKTQTVAPTERLLPGAPASANAIYHTVKKGETLYSIALEYGQSYRDVAAWNNLPDAAAIKDGQVLRVSPVNGMNGGVAAGVVVSPVILGTVQGRPLGEAPAAVPGSNTENRKSSPKGDKVAYTDRTYNQMSNAPVEPTPSTSQTEIKTVALAAAASDGIVWAWPASGKVIEPFDDVRHKGVAIAGKRGDPVLAAADGRVVYVGNGMRGYGNMIVVAHNDSYLSVYAHNDKILIEEKQVVKQGQKIAEIGASDTDRPKLHFEIRYKGKPTDPAKFLPERK